MVILLAVISLPVARPRMPAAVQPVLIAAYLENENITAGGATVMHVFITNQFTTTIDYDYAAMLIGNDKARLLDTANLHVLPGESLERVIKLTVGESGSYQCAAALKTDAALPVDAITGLVVNLTVTASLQKD